MTESRPQSKQCVDERRGGVLDTKISTASRSMTITIGSSHHFLFCLRNAQNSLSRLSPWCSAAAFSNSLVGLGDVWLMIDGILG